MQTMVLFTRTVKKIKGAAHKTGDVDVCSGGGAPSILPWPKIFSISSRFWEILAKSYAGVPPPEGQCPLLRGILDPPKEPM